MLKISQVAIKITAPDSVSCNQSLSQLSMAASINMKHLIRESMKVISNSEQKMYLGLKNSFSIPTIRSNIITLKVTN